MILDELANLTRQRIEKEKNKHPFSEVKKKAELIALREMEVQEFDYPFEEALRSPGLSIIAEVKKASPSKGVIAEDFPYLEIAKEYERSGANAISCLTEPVRFKGSDKYLTEIAESVTVPVLRKDFVIDPYMIYQAKIMGASAILLIAAILSDDELAEYFSIADRLGLSCLFEAHDKEEVMRCLNAGARIVGVNNRNLKDFSVDLNNSINLRKLVPEDVIFVAESGISDPDDVKRLKENGTDAVLIGEMLMRSDDKKRLIHKLKSCTGKSAPKIKICGLKSQEDIETVNELKPDFVGFVFADFSKRYIRAEEAQKLRKKLIPEIKAVGVFVDEDIKKLEEYVRLGIIDIVQLHGHEDETYIRQLKKDFPNVEVIKVFNMKQLQDCTVINNSSADYVMFDSGYGTGEVFNWNFIGDVDKPFFLAGGLTPENVSQAIEETKPFAVDVSSGVEKDGTKDAELINAFINNVRR